MIIMIESVQELPLTLISNSAPITFSVDDVRTRSASCCCNGWLQHQQGSPLYQLLDSGYYEIIFNINASSAAEGAVAFGLYQDRNNRTWNNGCINYNSCWGY